MKIKASKAHMEIIFPVILFLVFTLSALFVILYSARTYQHIVEESDVQYEKTTSLAYLTTKVRAMDANGNISVDEFFGIPALAIRQEIDGAPFVTYVYAYDGNLIELFTSEGNTSLAPGSGMVLFPAESFSPGFPSDGLLSLEVTEGGKTNTQLVTVFSAKSEWEGQ